MKIGMRLQRLLAPILCITIIFGLFTVPGFAADEAAETSREIEILSQLGVLDTTAAADTVIKETATDGLENIFGNNVPRLVYFENQDLSEPLLYGQAVRLLIDALGYSNLVRILGYDPDKAESYIHTARRIKLIDDTSKAASSEMTVGEWAVLLYRALIDVELMKPQYMSGDDISYIVSKGSSMLDEYMKLTRIKGIVKGVDNVSVVADNGYGNQRININGVWYTHSFTGDMFKYFGYSAEVYVDSDTRELKAITYLEGMNNSLVIEADDVAGASSATRMSYYSNSRKKDVTISGDADFVYNRELVTSYTAADLSLPDCKYTLIDNNDDGRYDVIIADKYTSVVVDYRQTDGQTIVDIDGNIYDLKEFYNDGGRMYDQKGREYGLNMMHQYSVVSYLMTKSGKISHIVVVDTKLNAKLTGIRDNMKYVSFDDVEYKTAAQYYENIEKYDKVKIGDSVMGMLDVNGKIIDIIYVEAMTKSAYLLAAETGIFGAMEILALDDDGTVKVLKLSNSVSLDGRKTGVESLLNGGVLGTGGELTPQLVIYKQNGEGVVTFIDTAVDKNKLGEFGFDEFTMNYSDTMLCMTMGGVNIFATKYILGADTKVFEIVKDSNGKIVRESLSVRTGTIFTDTESYNLKLYNVDENFVPEYAVYETTQNSGGWVNVKGGNVYMVEEIAECLDANGDRAYMLSAWGPTGKMSSWYFYDGDLASAGSASFTWSHSWSPDSRIWKYKLKDLPRGSIISVQTGTKGIAAFAAHHIPLEDNIIFEKTAAVSGNYQGLDTNKFNAGCLMSYGEVVDRVDMGFVINNHIPTDKEKLDGAVYPMTEWNRTIPANSTTQVLVYDSNRDMVYLDNANCIVPGDYVFMRRKTLTYNGIYVYK